MLIGGKKPINSDQKWRCLKWYTSLQTVILLQSIFSLFSCSSTFAILQTFSKMQLFVYIWSLFNLHKKSTFDNDHVCCWMCCEFPLICTIQNENKLQKLWEKWSNIWQNDQAVCQKRQLIRGLTVCSQVTNILLYDTQSGINKSTNREVKKTICVQSSVAITATKSLKCALSDRVWF